MKDDTDNLEFGTSSSSSLNEYPFRLYPQVDCSKDWKKENPENRKDDDDDAMITNSQSTSLRCYYGQDRHRPQTDSRPPINGDAATADDDVNDKWKNSAVLQDRRTVTSSGTTKSKKTTNDVIESTTSSQTRSAYYNTEENDDNDGQVQNSIYTLQKRAPSALLGYHHHHHQQQQQHPPEKLPSLPTDMAHLSPRTSSPYWAFSTNSSMTLSLREEGETDVDNDDGAQNTDSDQLTNITDHEGFSFSSSSAMGDIPKDTTRYSFNPSPLSFSDEASNTPKPILGLILTGKPIHDHDDDDDESRDSLFFETIKPQDPQQQQQNLPKHYTTNDRTLSEANIYNPMKTHHSIIQGNDLRAFLQKQESISTVTTKSNSTPSDAAAGDGGGCVSGINFDQRRLSDKEEAVFPYGEDYAIQCVTIRPVHDDPNESGEDTSSKLSDFYYSSSMEGQSGFAYNNEPSNTQADAKTNSRITSSAQETPRVAQSRLMFSGDPISNKYHSDETDFVHIQHKLLSPPDDSQVSESPRDERTTCDSHVSKHSTELQATTKNPISPNTDTIKQPQNKKKRSPVYNESETVIDGNNNNEKSKIASSDRILSKERNTPVVLPPLQKSDHCLAISSSVNYSETNQKHNSFITTKDRTSVVSKNNNKTKSATKKSEVDGGFIGSSSSKTKKNNNKMPSHVAVSDNVLASPAPAVVASTTTEHVGEELAIGITASTTTHEPTGNEPEILEPTLMSPQTTLSNDLSSDSMPISPIIRQLPNVQRMNSRSDSLVGAFFIPGPGLDDDNVSPGGYDSDLASAEQGEEVPEDPLPEPVAAFLRDEPPNLLQRPHSDRQLLGDLVPSMRILEPEEEENYEPSFKEKLVVISKDRYIRLVLLGGVLAILVAITLSIILNPPGSGNDDDDEPTTSKKPGTVSTWTMLGPRVTGYPKDNLLFGSSVSMCKSGKRLLVGSPGFSSLNENDGLNVGLAQIYDLVENNQEPYWKQIGRDIVGNIRNGQLGSSGSLSGNGLRFAVGAPSHDSDQYHGTVDVYEIYSSSFSEINPLGHSMVGDAKGDEFGHALALNYDGSIVAVGARNSDKNGKKSGQVRVLEYDDNQHVWNQRGNDINGGGPFNFFGSSVSISDSGDRIAIGATPNEDFRGYVWVFEYDHSSSLWKRMGQNLYGDEDFDLFGFSLAMSSTGTVLAIGSPRRHGFVRIFEFDDNESLWVPRGDDLRGLNQNEDFGHALSLSSNGNVVVIGGKGGNGVVRAFEYMNNSSSWTQILNDVTGMVEEGKFGWSVSVSKEGNIIACGGPKSTFSGVTDNGQVQAFQRPITDN